MSIRVREGKRGTRYQVRIRYRDPMTGRWNEEPGGTFRDEREAKRVERRLLNDRDRGLVVEGNKKVANYLDEWLGKVTKVSKRGRPLAPTTRRRYADAVSHISGIIGDVKLRDVRPVHIERTRDELLSRSTLAPQSVGDVLRVASQAFGKAVASGLIARNPADAKTVDRPVGNPEPFVVIDRKLGERILKAARGTDPWDVAAHLALGATLRREEVLGVQWKHVDLDEGTLRVERTLTYADGAAHFGPPKSTAGERTIHLPAFVLDALRRHKAAQAERLLKIGKRVGTDDLVVDDGIGEPWLPASFSKGWARFAEAHGCGDVSYHGLRHGAATWLLAAGVPDAVAVTIMGHADTRILRHYQDIVPELMQDAAARMDALFS